MTDTKIREDARKAMFAAVGAPVLVGKTVSEKLTSRFTDANTKATDFRAKFLKDARSEFEKWATEGESLVKKLQDGEALEDLTQRVDVDQFQQQVGKLRTQLEDIIESWRSNFMPDSERATKVTIEVEEAPKTATKPAAKPAAKKPAAKKPAPRSQRQEASGEDGCQASCQKASSEDGNQASRKAGRQEASCQNSCQASRQKDDGCQENRLTRSSRDLLQEEERERFGAPVLVDAHNFL